MVVVVVALADEDHDCGDSYDVFWQAIDTIINTTIKLYIYIQFCGDVDDGVYGLKKGLMITISLYI